MGNGEESPDVARHFKVMRYPTLLWLSGRTGEELHREVGDATCSLIFDVSESIVKRKQLAPSPSNREEVRREILEIQGRRILQAGQMPTAHPMWGSRRNG